MESDWLWQQETFPCVSFSSSLEEISSSNEVETITESIDISTHLVVFLIFVAPKADQRSQRQRRTSPIVENSPSMDQIFIGWTISSIRCQTSACQVEVSMSDNTDSRSIRLDLLKERWVLVFALSSNRINRCCWSFDQCVWIQWISKVEREICPSW